MGNLADTTDYSWDKTEFEEFLGWKESYTAEDYMPDYYAVVAWVIETERNVCKRFFGCSLGSNPYQNGQVQGAAEDFCYQLRKYVEHKQRCWLGGKMNDSEFVIDRDRGKQSDTN